MRLVDVAVKKFDGANGKTADDELKIATPVVPALVSLMRNVMLP